MPTEPTEAQKKIEALVESDIAEIKALGYPTTVAEQNQANYKAQNRGQQPPNP
jgi:hypothetical protein